MLRASREQTSEWTQHRTRAHATIRRGPEEIARTLLVAQSVAQPDLRVGRGLDGGAAHCVPHTCDGGLKDKEGTRGMTGPEL